MVKSSGTGSSYLMGIMVIKVIWWKGIPVRLIGVAVAVLLSGMTAVSVDLTQSVAQAQDAYEGEQYAEAARSYHAAYSRQPWSLSFLVAAIDAERLAGDYPAAERDLDRLADIRPLNGQELVWLGEAYAGQDRLEEALIIWEEARQTGSLDADTLSQLVDMYYVRGEWSRAASVLETLIHTYPGDPSLYIRLGILQALDEPEKALVTLTQAATINPAEADRLIPIRGSLFGWADQSPDYAYARLGLAYLGLDELRLAEAALSRAVAYNPAYGEALAYLAYTRSQLDQPALGAVQQAIALSPDSPTVHYLAGLIWKRRGRMWEARQAFEQARALDPDNPAFAVEIATTYQAEGQNERAEWWMLQAVELAPGDPRFQILLGQFYLDQEYRVEEIGFPFAQELVTRYPDNALAHDALGWAYFLTGDLGRAHDELQVALELDPSQARIHAHLGIVFEANRQIDMAIDHYLQAVELDPDGHGGLIARRALDRMGVEIP
jgi:tetratricopeptide (TPR) repeat protein